MKFSDLPVNSPLPDHAIPSGRSGARDAVSTQRGKAVGEIRESVETSPNSGPAESGKSNASLSKASESSGSRLAGHGAEVPGPDGIAADQGNSAGIPLDTSPPHSDSMLGADDPLWQQLAREIENNGTSKTLPLLAPLSAAHLEPATELLGRTLGKFRVEEEIARGGMGIILRSVDLQLDREVAVKLLLKHHLQNPQLQHQFTNEARITGRLQHPGIIPIYEMGVTTDARPYFAMKLVRGQTLAELLAARVPGDKNLPRLLTVFEQVCQTLSYTHASGVIHLDIKPANIMVGAFGEVHLMDWGLARSTEMACPPSEEVGEVAESGLPLSHDPRSSGGHPIQSADLWNDLPEGTVWGTPAYMSPEQAQGKCMDVRSDVFGLGGILCEILTGFPPYQGASLVEVCYQAARAELAITFDRLRSCGADDALVRLAMACLSDQPEDRPADASAVARELTLHLESLMQRAESDLERFFDLNLDLFCIAGLDGYFRRVNSNFPRVLGYSEKELVSRPFMEFVHPEDQAGTIEVMSKLKRGQPVVQFQNRYLASNNEWHCFEWTAKSIPSEGVVFAVARDISNLPRVETGCQLNPV